MAVVVCFPWGAGGNLVRNIISLDSRYEFCSETDHRYQWLLDYYREPVTPDTWLKREWSIRQQFYNRYYSGGIAYWNPDWLLAYDCHGTDQEIKIIQQNHQLPCYDRYRIDQGLRPEQTSPWHLQDCEYIFVIAKNIETITSIYYSKNPVLNQFSHVDESQRQHHALSTNQQLNKNLIDLSNTIKNKHVYCAEDLLASSDLVLDVVSKLKLSIPKENIETIHSTWLKSTHEVYYNYYNRELTL